MTVDILKTTIILTSPTVKKNLSILPFYLKAMYGYKNSLFQKLQILTCNFFRNKICYCTIFTEILTSARG